MSKPDYIAINRLLTTCRKIEMVTAEIYQALALAHAHHPVIERIWRKTAQEEIDHANQIDLAMRIKHGSLTGTAIEQGQAEEALGVAEKALAAIQLQAPGIESALCEAVRMERHFQQYHAYLACELSEGPTRQLFESLRKADAEHVAALEHAMEVVTQLGIGR